MQDLEDEDLGFEYNIPSKIQVFNMISEECKMDILKIRQQPGEVNGMP